MDISWKVIIRKQILFGQPYYSSAMLLDSLSRELSMIRRSSSLNSLRISGQSCNKNMKSEGLFLCIISIVY